MIKKSPIKAIAFMSSAAFLSVIGQVFWKISSLKFGLEFILGFVSYAIGAILMIRSYRYSTITFIQPFMSLSYIFSIFVGFFLFNENLSINKFFSLFFITLGLILISKNNDTH